ncbi:MAG: DUF6165 family protein [Rhodospirillaceae bacterium]
MKVKIEIAPGELFDKLSILEIKTERIRDRDRRRHVQAEYECLLAGRDLHLPASWKLDALFAELKSVNEELWDIEDRLRVHERDGDFGEEFVRLVRSVYLTKDRRAEIKQDFNRMLNGDIAEAKSCETY